jgi:hypothetical protein
MIRVLDSILMVLLLLVKLAMVVFGLMVTMEPFHPVLIVMVLVLHLNIWALGIMEKTL